MDEEILQEFLAESWENLTRLDTEIVALEKQPQDAGLLASIFRTIHTIKGTSGFLGLVGLGSVAHSAENVLGQMRDGRLSVTQDTISAVLQGVDRVKLLLTGLEETGSEPSLNHDELIQLLDAVAQSAETQAAAPPAPNPVVSSPVPEPTPVVIAPVAIPPETPKPTEAPQAPVAVVPAPAPKPPVAPTPAAANDGNDEELHPTVEASKKSVSELSIRVNVDVLDRLMNLVGELVLTRNQLLQMVRGEDESKYSGPITHLNRVTTDLQEGVMKTRMQPIGNAWSKLPRLVRDLAQQTGKHIELEMQGAETELDRTVLDAIKDPLTHMVRNSADHGLESPAARRAAGKSEVGKIRLNAYHEGGHVVIHVEDDGGGIKLARVREKAISQGLVTEAGAAKLSDKELLNFVFQAGFSTAEKVSSVSGRGVGMDVVKTQIEAIGGTVDLNTRAGVGTTVRIKIPLTLAIISALVVESGGLSLAIPQLGVVELVRLSAEDRHKIERIHQHEVFRLRNRLLPLVHLNHVLGLEDQHEEEDHDIHIVVVQVGEEQLGLIVDEVFDTEEIVVKPVGSLLKDIDIYQGTTILGDGRVIMILDVAGIATQFGNPQANASDKDKATDQDDEGQTTSLLLFDAGESTMAVQLSLVARLEEVPRDRIERSGSRLVVQYRGDLLPLLPVNGFNGSDSLDPQPVVVFSEGTKSMGLMVERVRDIIEDRLIVKMHSNRPGVLGTAIINGAATDILDIHHYISDAHPNWFDRKVEDHSKHILVIDDSIFMRQIISTALESEHYKVKTVASAREAIGLIEQGHKYDMIVSDIEMPEMDGFQFARWYQANREEPKPPLVALTTMFNDRYQTRGLQAGFKRYLKKFDADELLATIQDLWAEMPEEVGAST